MGETKQQVIDEGSSTFLIKIVVRLLWLLQVEMCRGSPAVRARITPSSRCWTVPQKDGELSTRAFKKIPGSPGEMM